MRLPFLLTALLLLAVGSAPVRAQLASYRMERYRWTAPVGTNPVVLRHQWNAGVTGVGLTRTEVRSPRTSVVLEGGSFQQGWVTNFPAAAGDTTGGLASLDASFPTGAYVLTALSTVTNPLTGRVTSRTNEISLTLRDDFTVPDPVVTNLPALQPLGASQEFRWPTHPASTEDYAAFYILEGRLDTNLLAQLMEQGAAALTNLAFVVAETRIPSDAGGYVASGLDPALDHVVWLEFHDNSPVPSGVPGVVGSVTVALTFHPADPGTVPLVLSAPSVDASGFRAHVQGAAGSAVRIDRLSADGTWTAVGTVLIGGSGGADFVLPSGSESLLVRAVLP